MQYLFKFSGTYCGCSITFITIAEVLSAVVVNLASSQRAMPTALRKVRNISPVLLYIGKMCRVNFCCHNLTYRPYLLLLLFIKQRDTIAFLCSFSFSH